MSEILTLLQGLSAKKSAKEEARDLRAQGALQLEESEAEALRIEEEGEQLEAKQKVGFLKSGVSLLGSPLLVLGKTFTGTQEQAAATRRRGRALSSLTVGKAKRVKRGGRAALLGSVAAASSEAFAKTGGG